MSLKNNYLIIILIQFLFYNIDVRYPVIFKASIYITNENIPQVQKEWLNISY